MSTTNTVSVDRLAKELESGREHKRPRVSSFWKKNDDAYNGIVPPYSKLPFNFHLPILSGFEDTLVAKIDEAPLIRFGGTQPGEARLGRIYDALWKSQSDRPDMDYAMADLAAKRHAARYGRAFLKVVGTKKPFAIDVMAIDPYDMVTDPNGGDDLEDHLFVAQDGIFRTEKQLKDGVKSGLYDADAVTRLLAGPTESRESYKIESDTNDRWASLTQSGFAYVTGGTRIYRLCEAMSYSDEGERMLVTWCPEAKVILKQGTLLERYGCDLLPWVSWAPFTDSKVFWSKAPDDDVRQAGEAARVTVMEMMTNNQKKNWGTKLYDPSRVSAADLTSSAPNGAYPTKPGTADMSGGIAAAFQVIPTQDITASEQVVTFLDRFVGQKTGVTPDAQGTSTEDTLGIYQGNLAQVADRMGLTSRYYKNAWRRIGTRFLWQAKRNLSGKVAVSVIGAKGNETEYLMARNVDPTFGVNVTGGSAEAAVSEVKRKSRGAAVTDILANPTTAATLNLSTAVEEKLKSAGFEEDEVRLLLNKDAGSDYRDQQLRAQENVEKLLEGEQVPLYQGATTVFVAEALEAAKAHTNGKGPEHDRLIAYANAHMKIAAKNAALDAYQKMEMAQALPPPPGQPPGGQPAPDMNQPLTQDPNVPANPGTALPAPQAG